VPRCDSAARVTIVRVVLVCPFPVGSRLGNRVTAVRWRKLIAGMGHRVAVVTGIPLPGYDLLVALHAGKSAAAVLWSRTTHPDRPIVVALTGTDLYRDILVDPDARRSLRLADRLVVLHDRAPLAVPRAVRPKVRLIRQSADSPPVQLRKRTRTFDVALVAHLRPEKDPLRAAAAARRLPAASRVRIVHAGRALTDELERAAQREQRMNPRYRWLGELAPARARELIARSRLLALTSLSEGGANVLGEAIVSGTPVIASRIPASLAALGADYPAFFPVGDTAALARLLARAESDPAFLAELTRRVRARRHLFAVSAERAAWRSLLAELDPPASRRATREAGHGRTLTWYSAKSPPPRLSLRTSQR
jgi:putative glycosyltransferase (TIGR04348 family)